MSSKYGPPSHSLHQPPPITRLCEPSQTPHRKSILSLYIKLHSAGIIHYDVSTRHLLTRPDHTLAIFDFDRSIVVDEGDDADLVRDAKRRELVKVRKLLAVGVGEDLG